MTSCTSACQGHRSARGSASAYSAVKKYVRPIREKNALTGSAPGEFRWTSAPEPSSSVLIAARPATSQTSLLRRSEPFISVGSRQ